MADRRCIIIGAGQAASQLSLCLRRQGWAGEILVVGAEAELPYQRPPLSKGYLKQVARAVLGSGDADLQQVPLVRQQSVYDAAGVNFRLGTRVVAIDRRDQSLCLDNGETLAWGQLALTTGAGVRRLDVPGAHLAGVCYLRTLADVARLRPYLSVGGQAVIIGGGYIGLEAAATLRGLGMQVTLIEALPQILQRVTAPGVAGFFRRLHREEGVSVHTGVAVTGFAGEQRVTAVQCDNGASYPADLVIIGIGVVPETRLAESVGLSVNNGIIVDSHCRTSDPNIVAAGDCARFFSPIYGRYVRLESVQNAVDQATVAAASIAGESRPYQAIPWFWSDQYDVKWQIAGLSQGYEQMVLRGDPEIGRCFAAFYLQGKRLLAVDAINSPQAFMVGKRLIASGQALDARALVDPGVDLRSLLA